MRAVYIVIRSMLLFFFLVAIFSGTLVVRNNTVIDKIFVGLIFGIVIALLPSILKFFKLPVNTGSLLLIGTIACFAFYFIGFYGLLLMPPFLNITGGNIDFGITGLYLKFADRTVALVVMSLTSAVSSVALEAMSKNSK